MAGSLLCDLLAPERSRFVVYNPSSLTPRRRMEKRHWFKPVLVQRPLELTQASLGPIHDSLTDQETGS